MMTRAALLLCVCAVANGESNGFQQIPQFYTTSDCTGGVDPASKTWSMNAKDGVAVRPFENSELYLQPWVFGECLTGKGTFSVKLVIDETACENNNTAEQFVLNHYTGSTTCHGAPAVTLLTFDQCVPYTGGSVKLVPKIDAEDMCALTDYVTNLAEGGVKVETWLGSKCEGIPLNTVTIKGSTKDCGTQPDCDGCCTDYDYDSCKAQSSFSFNLQACTKSGDSWRLGMKLRSYSNAQCTNEVDGIFNGVLEVGSCAAFKVNGNKGAAQLTFVPPMTIDVYCRALEVGLENKIDASIVEWGELNAGAGAVPHVLVLVAVVFAALL